MVATTEATKETKLKICPACPSHKCSPIKFIELKLIDTVS
jgi:hypothetical protein